MFVVVIINANYEKADGANPFLTRLNIITYFNVEDHSSDTVIVNG